MAKLVEKYIVLFLELFLAGKGRVQRIWQQIGSIPICAPYSQGMKWEIITTLMSLVYFTSSFQQNPFIWKVNGAQEGNLAKFVY